MSSCQHEHSGHGDHHHGHEHDHTDDVTPATQSLLYEQIEFDGINTLNEAEPLSGAAIVKKTWAQRSDVQPELHSDADEQLLMTIPFAGQVRLQSIILRTSTTSSAPKDLKIFINRDDLDFSTAAELQPTQTLELAQTSEIQEHPVKRALFNTTRTLTLFFESNHGIGDEDVTRISYLAFKGEYMKLSKEPITVLYEAAANPADHPVIPGTKNSLDNHLSSAAGGL